eukprot:scaffold8347_cov62-Phaeocystis_antarctica.AAC.6
MPTAISSMPTAVPSPMPTATSSMPTAVPSPMPTATSSTPTAVPSPMLPPCTLPCTPPCTLPRTLLSPTATEPTREPLVGEALLLVLAEARRSKLSSTCTSCSAPSTTATTTHGIESCLARSSCSAALTACSEALLMSLPSVSSRLASAARAICVSTFSASSACVCLSCCRWANGKTAMYPADMATTSELRLPPENIDISPISSPTPRGGMRGSPSTICTQHARARRLALSISALVRVAWSARTHAGGGCRPGAHRCERAFEDDAEECGLLILDDDLLTLHELEHG